MLPPLQPSIGQFATDQLRSMLEDIEARRKEAEDKAAGRDKNDKLVGVTADPISAAANEKINAHFFGALKVDPDPMATLIARFSSVLGVEQDAGESRSSFATRLNDAVTMLSFGKVDAGGNAVKITLKSVGVTEEEVISVLNGTAKGPQDPMAEMAARIAKQAGLTGEEDGFGQEISSALMAVRAGLPQDERTFEKLTGLKDLGLTAQDVIAAVANPWSDAAQKVKKALADQAEGQTGMTREMKKVLQRLEDVADPKTVEELKQRDTKPEAGRVEDAETRAERKQELQVLEHAEKLADIREQQDAVREHLEQADGTRAGDATVSTDASLQVIQTLAALPEEPAADDNETIGESAEGEGLADSLSEAAPVLQAEDEVREILQLAELAEEIGVLTLPVDDIGVYELLRRRAA